MVFALAVIAVCGAAWHFHSQALARQKISRYASPPEGSKAVLAGDTRFSVRIGLGKEGFPPVFFVGGPGEWSEHWKRSIQLVSELGFPSIGVDLPPWGYSDRPEGDDYTRPAQGKRLATLIQTIAPKKSMIVCHSYSCQAVLTAAAQMPDRIAGLVLISPAMGWTSPTQTKAESPPYWTAALGVQPIRLALASAATDPRFAKDLLVRALYRKEAATDEAMVPYLHQMQIEGKTEELAKWFADFMMKPDPRIVEDKDFYASLRFPSLLIWGDQDPIAPIWQSERLSKALAMPPKLVLLKDVGHIPQLEDPPALEQALKDFLAGFSPPPPPPKK